MAKRKTDSDYHRLAERRCIRWIGPFPKNTKSSTLWKCAKDHQFAACYGNINQGMDCKKCVLERNAANQRHSNADYHLLARRQGFHWIGPPVTSALSVTVWECPDGHRWSARYNDIQQGKGCGQCGRARSAHRRRNKPADYIALAYNRGFSWLGPIVQNTKQKTKWRCGNGHEWFAHFNSIHQGSGCSKCTGLARKAVSDFHNLAERKGFRWLGIAASSTGSKTDWECKKGHRFPATYDSIRSDHGCPHCSGKAKKKNADYEKLAKTRGLNWLGPPVSSNKTLTRWQCAAGHIFESTFNRIYYCTASGCLICSGHSLKTVEDYRNLAELFGFDWLGPEVRNTAANTRWRCRNGHVWPATYSTIRRGHGCPNCFDMVNGVSVSKAQRMLCEMIEGELNVRVGRYTIDIVKRMGKVNIAIEYDSWFFHGDGEAHDRMKDQALLNADWRMLRIRSNKLIPSKGQIDDALDRLVAGELWLDIVLEDWGKGPVASSVLWGQRNRCERRTVDEPLV